MNTLLAVVAVTGLLHSLLIFLVVVLVAVVVFWAVTQFISDARIRNIIGAIIAIAVLIYALSLFLPGL